MRQFLSDISRSKFIVVTETVEGVSGLSGSCKEGREEQHCNAFRRPS